ncbi:MAG: substrate-binding domain-containing protein [Planctomycetota bacterium]|jgi:hypothetical protein
MRTLIAFIALLGVATVGLADPEPDAPEGKEYGLSIFKLGEKFATDKKAGDSIDKFCSWLTDNVEDSKFTRRGVRNKPAEFETLLKKEDTAIAVVSPGFYLAHKEDLKLEAFAEARRGDLDGEVYSLVGREKTEDYPAGKTVATSLSKDPEYLNRVVFPKSKDANGIAWKHASNTFDACYDIFDEVKGAPDYVLVDQLTLKQIKEDPDLKELTVVWTSNTFSQDLVVEIDGRLGDARKNIADALTKLNDTDAGKKIGELIQSPIFPEHNKTRLAEMETLWAKE